MPPGWVVVWPLLPELRREAFLAFSRFAGRIRFGHTYANFYNQRDDVAAALFTSRTRLPFEFRWVDGTMVVERNRSQDASLVPGTRVLAIDGVALHDVRAEELDRPAVLLQRQPSAGGDGQCQRVR